ncbi:hypothetical protein ZTR_10696 [Talaromyces verruculosus]|nr:hypothetical protein ZTR_10696 [Talaromyces verruculosus]
MSIYSHSLELSPLDLIPPRYYTRLALSFRTTASTQSDILQKLQTSLDEICKTSIPWLGGKVLSSTKDATQKPGLQVCWNENDSPSIKYMDPCPGSYNEVAAAGLPLTTIPEDRWPTPILVDEKLHRAGAPVLAVGLVPFGAGDGVMLCVCFHHNVVDAGGMAEVLRVWAGVLCGVSAPILVGISERVDRLSTALAAARTSESDNNSSLDSLLATHPEYTTSPLHFDANHFANCTSTVLTVSIPKIERLKAKLAKYSNSPPTVNTVLCAILWCAVTRIRQRRDPTLFASGEKSRLGMSVNGRMRVDPSFGRPGTKDFYFGNVYLYALAELDAPDSSSAEDVPPIDERILAPICDAIAACYSPNKLDANYIAGLSHLVSNLDKSRALFPAWSISSGRDLAITSWANLGLYEMRFGDALGYPEFVRLPYSKLDSAAIILPRRRTEMGSGSMAKTASESLEVIVMLRECDLQALLEDKLWAEIVPTEKPRNNRLRHKSRILNTVLSASTRFLSKIY